MVEYTEWTEIVHETFKDAGGDYDQNPATQVTSQAADVWQQRKEQLQASSRSQAERIAGELM